MTGSRLRSSGRLTYVWGVLSLVFFLLAFNAHFQNRDRIIHDDIVFNLHHLTQSGNGDLAVYLPEGFYIQQIVSSVGWRQYPTTMAVTPDGRIFLAIKQGYIRVIENDVLLPNPMITFQDVYHQGGEPGLVGMVLDPDFATNGYLYVYYTYKYFPNPADPNTFNKWIRISRVTVTGNTASNETILMEITDQDGMWFHFAGGMRFGTDGKLYVAVGDLTVPQNSQMLTNLYGKILRINRDGTIPTDNPFYHQLTGDLRAIYALGLRNPFRIDIHPETGVLHINDVGQASWEEINLGRPGANYGWPVTEGFFQNRPEFDNPIYVYPHQNGDCAITGAAFYAPPIQLFPQEYRHDYFFLDYCSGWVRRLRQDANGNYVALPFMSGYGFGGADLFVDNAGFLYFLDQEYGKVYRIGYNQPNQPPILTFQPQSIRVREGDPATFTCNGVGAQPVSFRWQRDGNDIPNATGKVYTIASATLDDDGAQFRCVLTNPYGEVTSTPATLGIATGEPPTATITIIPDTQYTAGTSFEFRGQATDPEDGVLPPSAFQWEILFHHDDHTHPFYSITKGIRRDTVYIPNITETDANVWYRVYLTVTDSSGLTYSTHKDIYPIVSTLTIQTDPPGLQVALDGRPLNAPHSVQGVAGVIREIGTVSPQTHNGRTLHFEGWSDGGAMVHQIHTPAEDTVFTASFVELVPVTVQTNPPGLAFAVNDQTFTTSETVTLPAPRTATLAVVTPQIIDGEAWYFTGWSHGAGTPTTDVLITGAATYTANFVRGAELLVNGGFEELRRNGRLPMVWQNMNLSANDRVRCNNANNIFANSGMCALRLTGSGRRATVYQINRDSAALELLTPGNRLYLSGYIDSRRINGNAQINLVVRYLDGTVERLRLRVPAGNSDGYQYYEDWIELNSPVRQVRVNVLYNGTTGRVLVDDVSLSLRDFNGTLNLVDQGGDGVPDLLPLPEDFRR